MVVGCHAGEGVVARLFKCSVQMSVKLGLSQSGNSGLRDSERGRFMQGVFCKGLVRTSWAISLSFRNGTGGWDVVVSVAMSLWLSFRGRIKDMGV